MSATVHAVLSLLVGAVSAPMPHSQAGAVPAPRPAAPPSANVRPAAPRPIAVVTLGIGTLATACGLSLVTIGVESRSIATQGRTEGEFLGRRDGAKRLLAVGIPLATIGVGTVIAGVVWIVRDRRRARGPGSHRK